MVAPDGLHEGVLLVLAPRPPCATPVLNQSAWCARQGQLSRARLPAVVQVHLAVHTHDSSPLITEELRGEETSGCV